MVDLGPVGVLSCRLPSLSRWALHSSNPRCHPLERPLTTAAPSPPQPSHRRSPLTAAPRDSAFDAPALHVHLHACMNAAPPANSKTPASPRVCPAHTPPYHPHYYSGSSSLESPARRPMPHCPTPFRAITSGDAVHSRHRKRQHLIPHSRYGNTISHLTHLTWDHNPVQLRKFAPLHPCAHRSHCRISGRILPTMVRYTADRELWRWV